MGKINVGEERQQLLERLNAHLLRLMQRMISQCHSPGRVSIVDTGPAGRPRYRLLVADASATADA